MPLIQLGLMLFITVVGFYALYSVLPGCAIIMMVYGVWVIFCETFKTKDKVK